MLPGNSGPLSRYWNQTPVQLQINIEEVYMLLSEIESKQLLMKADIPVSHALLAVSKKQAVSLSRQLGYPVVLKISSRDIIHKSDCGGVRLNLNNAAEVGRAYSDIVKSVKRKLPRAAIQGVSVQKMAACGIEVIISMFRDPQFGPVLVFGLGGMWVEILKDITLGIIPISEKDALSMIEEIRGYPLLRGYRGLQPASIPLLEKMLCAISRFVEHHPEIKELELNPVLVYSDSALAVDARIFIEDQFNPLEAALKLPPPSPDVSQLFSPASVVIAGASPGKETSFTGRVITSLKQAGFPAIYPVNPKYTEVQGLPCYPDLQSIPEEVDQVIASIPAAATLKLTDDCAVKGVKAIQFFSAGFSESGDSALAELEQQLLLKARAGGFRIIGPNCVGIISTRSRFITNPTIPLEPGQIAFVTQSGGHATYLPYIGAPRGLKFSKIISYGNALDVDESELIDYLADDPETGIISAYIEGVRDGKKFIDAVRKASLRKPVVILKGGISQAGQRTARGHTASLTSSNEVFSALCRQLNVIRVESMEELADILVLLQFINQPFAGKGAAVIGAGGGPSVAAGDEMERYGLELPELSAATISRLKEFLSPAGSILTNPVDAGELISPVSIYKTITTLSEEEKICILIYHMGFHPLSLWGSGRLSARPHVDELIEAFSKAQRKVKKPIVLVLNPAADRTGTDEFLQVQQACVKAGLPVIYSMSAAARAISRLYHRTAN